MPENAGLYQKFDVTRRDGRDRPGGDREGAAYFVLDVIHDPLAVPALRAYAQAADRRGMVELAKALQWLLVELETGRPGEMVQALREPKP
jgi:hypothetical protein